MTDQLNHINSTRKAGKVPILDFLSRCSWLIWCGTVQQEMTYPSYLDVFSVTLVASLFRSCQCVKLSDFSVRSFSMHFFSDLWFLHWICYLYCIVEFVKWSKRIMYSQVSLFESNEWISHWICQCHFFFLFHDSFIRLHSVLMECNE